MDGLLTYSLGRLAHLACPLRGLAASPETSERSVQPPETETNLEPPATPPQTECENELAASRSIFPFISRPLYASFSVITGPSLSDSCSRTLVDLENSQKLSGKDS